ncbi:alkene reductase [Actinomadura sp. NPDC000600]|uniref:alkene reductase n=1 Tax=Actinomadura sp. NPDC000600 TaxID=3154262 RepID=UPI003399B830
MIRHDQGSEPGAQPLLRPVALGDLELPNRVVMAPLTRARASGRGLVPTDLHAAYYGQRATAGLIIAEAAWVGERAIGAPGVPGVYTERQVEGWRRVTDVVHALGGRIVLQLWHAGAHSHPDHLGGARPGGPSAVDPGEECWTAAGPRATVTPREMTRAEIERTVADYGAASARARRAGFDGVEVAANGTYLLAQFLNPRLNRRADAYGTDRARLLLEVVDAVAAAWDGRRAGVRLSPYWTVHDASPGARRGDYPYTADEGALAAYDSLVAELGTRPLAYLHLRGRALTEPGATPDFDEFARYRKLFGGPLVANHGFGRESGNAVVEAGIADAVAFGRPFIANPDLVARFALGQGTARSDEATHYGGGARGYVDYPIWPGP